MDMPTFIIELLKVAAWPVVVGGGLVLLRREIKAVVGSLTRLKYKSFEAEFGRQAAEVRSEAEEMVQLPAAQEAAARLPTDMLLRLLDVSPSAAVMEAWRRIENAAREAAIRRGALQVQTGTPSAAKLGSALASNQVLSADHLALYHDLRGLRNQAAHLSDSVVSRKAAIDYIDAAQRLVSALEAA
jgi:hypothetical protein